MIELWRIHYLSSYWFHSLTPLILALFYYFISITFFKHHSISLFSQADFCSLSPPSISLPSISVCELVLALFPHLLLPLAWFNCPVLSGSEEVLTLQFRWGFSPSSPRSHDQSRLLLWGALITTLTTQVFLSTRAPCPSPRTETPPYHTRFGVCWQRPGRWWRWRWRWRRGLPSVFFYVRPVVTRRTPVFLLASPVSPVPSPHPLVGLSPGVLPESSSRGAVLDADLLIGGSPRALGVPRWALMSPRWELPAN